MLRQPPVSPAVRGQGQHVPAQPAAQEVQHLAVAAVLSPDVPQAQGAQGALPCRPAAEIPHAGKIFLHAAGAVVSLEAVQGHADLVDPRQSMAPPGEQRPVGGDAHPEVQLPGDGQDLLQLRVQQRLPHHMEVQIRRVAPELFRQQPEVLRPHIPRRAAGPRAEGAGQVAHVGDLHIGPVEHAAILLSKRLKCYFTTSDAVLKAPGAKCSKKGNDFSPAMGYNRPT